MVERGGPGKTRQMGDENEKETFQGRTSRSQTAWAAVTKHRRLSGFCQTKFMSHSPGGWGGPGEGGGRFSAWRGPHVTCLVSRVCSWRGFASG